MASAACASEGEGTVRVATGGAEYSIHWRAQTEGKAPANDAHLQEHAEPGRAGDGPGGSESEDSKDEGALQEASV